MAHDSAAESSDRQEDKVHRWREDLLRPLGETFGFPVGTKHAANGLPTVLCLGNHSSGKSTFINYLAGEDIQETGVAPTDDCFTLIMYGEPADTEDGRSMVINPALPFGNLQQYGNNFLDHLRLKRRPQAALREICLIDSPGLIDNPGQGTDSARGYDFKAVVRTLAESADLVVFFFDPEKPGTTGESLRVFTDSLSDVMYKLLIVFNKVDTFDDVRDFARTYGSLCWNLSRVVRTKDIPHIFCTYVPGHTTGRTRTIDLSDFEKSTEQLQDEIAQVGSRRRSNMVGAFLDMSRQLVVHASMVRLIGWRILTARLSLWALALLLLLVGGWLLFYHRTETFLFWTAIASLVVGGGLLAGTQWILKYRLRRAIHDLDATFQERFRNELLQQDDSRFLLGIWEAVKPRTVKFLETVGPGGIPFSPMWRTKIKKLQQVIDQEAPDLLRTKSSSSSLSSSSS